MAVAGVSTAIPQRSTKGQGDIANSAIEMVDSAIEYCENMTGYRGRDQIAAALRVETPEAHDYFRHSIARQVARYLTNLDETVVSVYTHSFGDAEEEGEGRTVRISTPINIILHVRRKTAALSSIVAYLDHQLLESYKQLVSPRGEKIASILDIQMVDDEDIRRGTGFGVVLRSTYSKPVRLWPE